MSVVTYAAVYPYSKYGIDFVIPRSESTRISRLDSQYGTSKVIFGTGILISDRVKAEREKAVREKAEHWELSER